VVGHQAVPVNRHAKLSPVSDESFEIGLVVTLIPKGFLSVIAPDNDVVEKTAGVNPRTTSHSGPDITEEGQIVKNQKSDPERTPKTPSGARDAAGYR
jgi:hypothetical protein